MLWSILPPLPARLATAFLALALATGSLSASEFQPSSYTTGAQYGPVVAMDGAGRFIVVWDDSGRGGAGFGVFARRYDALGAPLGDDFAVNTTTASDQLMPDVAVDSAGNFVVVWTSYYGSSLDGGIFAQKFDSDGMADGSEFQVSADASSRQIYPNVSLNDSGEVVVVWAHYAGSNNQASDVTGQRFDTLGPVGGQFAVNTHTPDYQSFPSVAINADGGFVVVWDSADQVHPSNSAEDVFARMYDSGGMAAASEFLVNVSTAESQRFPRVARDDAGDFVVVWDSYTDGIDNNDVLARRFDSTGNPKEGEFVVNTYTTSSQKAPGVAMDGSGSFLVTWQSQSQDGSAQSVFAQRFDSAGMQDGGEFQVNTYTTGSQIGPEVAMNDAGGFVIAWTDTLRDGSLDGVFGRHFPSDRPSSDLSVAICGTDAHHAWVRFENGGNNPNIFYRRCTVGGSCSATLKMVGAATVEAQPAVACDGSTVLVVWEDYRDGNADIASRRSTDGGTSFGGLEFLVRGPADETNPALAMTPGVALLVFEDFRNGNKDLASRRSTDGGATWGTFTFLVRSPFDDSDPVLAMDGTLAFLGWVDRRFANQDIAYRRSTTSGTSWENLTFLVKAPTVESDPTIGLDGSTVMVTWADSRNGVQDLAYRRSLTSAASFEGLTFLVKAPTDDSEPNLRISGDDAVLAWVDQRGGNQSISFRRSGDSGATWGATSRLVGAPTDEFDPGCALESSLAVCGWTDMRTGDAIPNTRNSLDGGQSWSPRQELD